MMQWSNLKLNRCPKCNGDFIKTLVGGTPGMVLYKCGFQINTRQYKEIVADRVQEQLKAREEEQEESFSWAQPDI